MGADFGACRLIFGEADGFPGLTVPPEDDGRLIITENDIRYEIDYKTGQKTGFYLDQKYNRASVACIVKGRRVLDCFTHTGAFALNAAAAGAVSVTAVDISEDAIALARKNAELNGLSNKINFVRADVFDYLTELAKSRGAYDLIILDPPAFAKSSSTVKNAQRGYREINRLAMKILPRGGFLRHARAHIS
jgi:23S rRNA (cytosine1962-C5)-methyltransferase